MTEAYRREKLPWPPSEGARAILRLGRDALHVTVRVTRVNDGILYEGLSGGGLYLLTPESELYAGELCTATR